MDLPEEPDERAHAEWNEGFQAELTIRDKFSYRVDEVKERGGTDTGPMPSELLLGSLAGCMCLALSHVVRKREMESPDLEVIVEGYHDPDAFRFRTIRVLTRSSLPETDLSRLVQKARPYCYVSNTLEDGCELEYDVVSTTSPAGGSHEST